MSGRPFELSESELDRTLGRWFAGGPETLPTAAIQAALEEIVTTRQQRPLRGQLKRHDIHWRPAAVMAGVTLTVFLAVAVTISPALVGIGTNPTATPTTGASAEPSASSTPGGSSSFADSEHDWTITLPGVWRRAPFQGVISPASLTQRFEEPALDRSLTISRGAEPADGRSITAICSVETKGHALCADLAIPVDPGNPLNGVALVEGFLDRCDGGCPIARSETRLGGDEAIRLELTIDARRLTYVYGTHESRPVILWWDEDAAIADPIITAVMRAGFKYTDTPAPTPRVAVSDLVPFRNEAWGYEVSVPALWLKGVEPSHLVSFRGLKILAGDREGRFDGCHRPLRLTCDDTPITTLADLEGAIQSAPDPDLQKSTAEHFDTTLGGEPARRERVDTRPFLSGPPAFYSVYAIHHGRPLVLAFDQRSIMDGDLPTSVVDAIVLSFRFLD